jgi:Fe-S-cluster containining protein
MESVSANDAPTVPLRLDLAAGNLRMSQRVAVPEEPIAPPQLVRVSLQLIDTLTTAIVPRLAAEGHPVSCAKGCAACCRYLVHISEPEAYYVHDLVQRLPESRRSEIQARFAAALERLDAAGLLDSLRRCQTLSLAEVRVRAADYVRLQIPCPFLENESCSIYADRPVTCREYLVTSPPENCSRVDEVGVHPLRLPVSFFRGLARFGVPADAPTQYRWLPLVLALEWAESHPDNSIPRPGPELLKALVENLGVPARIARVPT